VFGVIELLPLALTSSFIELNIFNQPDAYGIVGSQFERKRGRFRSTRVNAVRINNTNISYRVSK